MRTNRKVKSVIKTHEGAPAKQTSHENQLRRSVMSCMLWEGEFYENGDSIADRIKTLVAKVNPEVVAKIAIQAREEMKLRHVPLLIVREMARLDSHKHLVKTTLARVIQRPDELSEFVSIYWKDGRRPLSGQVKKGLALAFTKFNAFELAKYNRDGAVKLRDVLFLCHAKPINDAMEQTWKQLIDGKLATPDTWEVALSEGGDKKKSWERLLKENKLGALALLRNLRNMREANVKPDLIKKALTNLKTERVLPYRFIAAARYAPDFEPQLEDAMFRSLDNTEKFNGHTLLLVDVSGSMDSAISSKSDLTRLDAACGLAMLLRESCESLAVRTFSTQVANVPNRRGFALRDAIVKSQMHGGTYLGNALNIINRTENYDRIIIITDEQSSDRVPDPISKNAYIINVASYKNGVGYGKWTHVDGWSEAVVNYIKEFEKEY